MMEFKFEVKETKDSSEIEINNFYELAKKADQVELNGLLFGIQNSHLLGFCYNNDLLVGISCIKNPINNYKKRIFSNAGIENESDNFQFELGYAFTEENYRGNRIGYRLNEYLVSKLLKSNIYANNCQLWNENYFDKAWF